jgi:GT2 family glycosyltransferase
MREPHSGEAPATVAVVVVPRERLSTTLRCLEHIYACTDVPFRVLVVDANGPPNLAEAVSTFARRHGACEVLRLDRFVLPYEARNLALAHPSTRTPWVAFVDNDVKVGPGWLGALLAAAEEAKTDVAHPLYLIEQAGRARIHMSRGTLREVGTGTSARLLPVMEQRGAPLDAAQGLARQVDDLLEFHAFLARRRIYDELGPFPELCLGEDVEFSMRLRERGIPIVFEPRSVVTYVADPVTEPTDEAYFGFRWTSPLGPRSIEALRGRWPIVEGYWDGKLSWSRRHRRLSRRWFGVALALRRFVERGRFGAWLLRLVGAGSRR